METRCASQSFDDISTFRASKQNISVSPIDSIPHEILTSIFEVTCNPDRLRANDIATMEDDRIATMEQICSVSRHWRNVAIHSPRLWSNINVSCWTTPEVVTTRLERSQSCTLTIALDLSKNYSGIMAPNHLISLVVAHIHRWGSLYVLSSELWFLEHIHPHFHNHPAPVLQHVELDLFRDTPLPQVPIEVSIAFAPTSLRIRSASPTSLPSLCKLTSLDLAYSRSPWNSKLEYDLLRDFLTSCSVLTTLVIHGAVLSEIPENGATIDMPFLRSLAINFRLNFRRNPRDHTYIFTHLCAPALEYLEISSLECTPDVISDITEHIERTNYSALHTLRLTRFEIDSETGLYPFPFHALSAVQHLQLFETYGEQVLPLENCLDHDGSSIVGDLPWPKLRSVTLYRPNLMDLHWLQCMASSRLTKEAPLSNAHLSRPNSLPLFRSAKWLQGHLQVAEFDDGENGFINVQQQDADGSGRESSVSWEWDEPYGRDSDSDGSVDHYGQNDFDYFYV